MSKDRETRYFWEIIQEGCSDPCGADLHGFQTWREALAAGDAERLRLGLTMAAGYYTIVQEVVGCIPAPKKS